MVAATRWLPADPAPSMNQDEVHVWRVPLTLTEPEVERVTHCLDEDEQERAARFRRAHDGRCYRIAHSTVRTLLGAYLQREPQQIHFIRGPGGKPELAGAETGLRLTLSHSHELTLIAIARDRELGVDIEQIRPDLANLSVVERLFPTEELERLRAVPPNLWPEIFSEGWTRYEAGLKARGVGIGNARSTSADDHRWRCLELDPGPGYRAALVVEPPASAVRCWDFRYGFWH